MYGAAAVGVPRQKKKKKKKGQKSLCEVMMMYGDDGEHGWQVTLYDGN
jgi:hypothetical protein